MAIGTNKFGYNGGRFYSFFNRPVWFDCNFLVDATNTNGLGVSSLKGAGVRNVFMNTSATPGRGTGGYLNPNPAAGYAIIQLHNNYNRYGGGFSGIVAPVTGSSLAINATALTPGNPYVITAVGHAAAGTVTIAPIADVSGSLASTWFRIYDAYGNTYIVWFSVSGVGAAPVGVSGTLVQQSILSGATAAQIGAALVITLAALPAAQPGNLTAPTGVFSFTASGTTTVTVVSTATNPFGPLPGVPIDGTIPTGFTFAATVFNTNAQDWSGVGLQAGVTPAIGASFIATTSGVSSGGGSTGTVKAPGVSLISAIDIIGDPNQTLAPAPFAGSGNVGGYLLVQFLAPTSSSVTTPIATAPSNLSLVSLGFYVEASSVLISGE